MPPPDVPTELTVQLPLPPVSQQARAEAKAAFQTQIRKSLEAYDFLLSGDVSVAVEWSVSQQTRYETDRSPDVDNIIKPLVDALVGPSGIMIDDNQIQHVSCHWIDSYTGDETVSVHLRWSPDEWQRKKGLFFVQLDGGLCLPLSEQANPKFQLSVVDLYCSALRLRQKMLQSGAAYYDANICMPVQRLFHRTRLGAFKVVHEAEFRAAGAP